MEELLHPGEECDQARSDHLIHNPKSKIQNWEGPGALRGLLGGVDAGGTKVAVLVVEAAGNEYRVLSRTTVPTVLDSPEATLSGIAGAVRQAVEMAGAQVSEVRSVGVGVPGRVDPETGWVRKAVNLGWEELPVGAELSAQLGVPCFLENDVRLAALGVQRLTAGPPPRNMMYLSVGTGIAAGLILDGRVYRGAHGLAGEVGHMVVEPEGPACRCRGHGCLEALVAGPAIARLGEEAAKSSGDTLLRRLLPGAITAADVYQAASEGDAAAEAIAREVGRYLALALQQLIVAYDVEQIVIGGGVSRNGDAFLQPVLDELARLREGSALSSETVQPDKINLLPPGYEAGAWGAIMLAGNQIL
ncbi:MAG: ROK family protein [Chloroflexia bacterium]